MRIALILPGLGRVQRGAETAFLELARRLAAAPGVDVGLFGSGREGLGGLPIRVIDCPPRERFEGWPRFPAFRTECHYEEFGFARRLARSGLFRPADFDVVLSCTYPHVNWFLRRACRAAGSARHVFATQNGDWMCRADSREYRWFRCDGLVCINPAHHERHRDRYRSALIPNGVDADDFRPRSGLGADDGLEGVPPPGSGRVVLMVSALIESKRVADGVRAAAKVPGAFLLLAGDGPGRSAIAALAGDLLPGRHKLLGSVPRAAMPALYRRADAFLHMSRDEPFGIVYLEAAASGLPVVAHDGEVPRWVLGPSAVYADTGDTVAVARALERALSPSCGPRLGAEARRRVAEGWTWHAQAEKYLAFFRDLTEPRAGLPTLPMSSARPRLRVGPTYGVDLNNPGLVTHG